MSEKQALDMTDMQSVCLNAEGLARELMKKHNGNISEVEKEIAQIKIPQKVAEVKGFNFREEVLWAAKWMLSKFPYFPVCGKNQILLPR